MADEQAVQTNEPETTVTPEPTLEDVYKSVEPEPAITPQAAPVYIPPAAPAAPVIPDPYDTENFKAYLAEQAKGNAATQNALRQLSGYLTQAQMKEAQSALQADLKSAVDIVNEVVGHSRPKVIEAMLDAKAREDVRFQSLWNNRSKNPTAWNNALKAVAKEFATELDVKVDPALRAAQRARKLSQSQMATTTAETSADEKLGNLQGSDFEAGWQRVLNGGNL